MGNRQAEKIKPSNLGPLTPFELGHLFERIIRSWGADNVRVLGSPLAPVVELPLERSVILSGSLKGLFTARCSPDFPAWLRDQRQETPLGRYPVEEVFEELVSFFCLSLSHRFWQPHLFQVGPIQPFASQPEFWPLLPPHVACALEIEGHRVELRLWMQD